MQNTRAPVRCQYLSSSVPFRRCGLQSSVQGEIKLDVHVVIPCLRAAAVEEKMGLGEKYGSMSATEVRLSLGTLLGLLARPHLKVILALLGPQPDSTKESLGVMRKKKSPHTHEHVWMDVSEWRPFSDSIRQRPNRFEMS